MRTGAAKAALVVERETSNSRQNEHSIRGREAWVDGPKYFVQEKVEPHGRTAQGLSDLCWASFDF